MDYLGYNCIENCPAEYPYYFEGEYQCKKSCPNFIEDFKCVTFCSEQKPFLNGSICQDTCIGGYIKDKNICNYGHFNEDCKFYKKQNGIIYCLQECALSKPDNECVTDTTKCGCLGNGAKWNGFCYSSSYNPIEAVKSNKNKI